MKYDIKQGTLLLSTYLSNSPFGVNNKNDIKDL